MSQDDLLRPNRVLPEVRSAFAGRENVSVIIGLTQETRDSLIAANPGGDIHELLLEPLRENLVNAEAVSASDNFVFAKVNLETLDQLEGNTAVARVWWDKPMQRLWSETDSTVKTAPVRQLFSADGNGIGWAVIDSGISETHDYFSNLPVVKQQDLNFVGGPYTDAVGHGTHVAGILRKLSPETEIWDFKVLDDQGFGSASGVIRAMEEVREINLRAGRLLIHGVNMSLGGPVPVGSYGIGHSPECQEVSRLVESGVVACVAAGNDGFKEIVIRRQGADVGFPTFLDLGIGDPANAEDAITVGSVHKTNPHTYGPSYFSSRGPTGDGRAKPDVMAPGEKIRSAIPGGSGDREAELSGTSMATTVV